MTLIRQVSCGSCGKPHRIHRQLERGIRYRFCCKRCGALVTFSTTCVRWACRPDDAPQGTFSGTSTLARPRAQRPASVGRPATPPPIPEQVLRREPPAAARDTVMCGAPPVHISPLMRRGVERGRESSRVRWLRQRRRAAG